MSLRYQGTLSEAEAFMQNPLQLAYIGDAVWDMLVRYDQMIKKLNLRHLHQECISRVNARAQANALSCMIPDLTERELEVVRRGRNAHVHHPVPRNQTPADYAAATGLEALMGYLYLSGQTDRLLALYQLSMKEDEHG